MKRIIIFSLVYLLLAGCGNSLSTSGKEISLRMKSGQQVKYLLLAVRDSSIVVFPPDEIYDERITISHAKIIKKDSITLITTDVAPMPIIIGGCIGGIAGFAAAEAIPHTSSIQGDVVSIAPSFMWFFIPIGAVLGAFIAAGVESANSDNQFNPNDSISKNKLRKISAYPHGEPELLKLIR